LYSDVSDVKPEYPGGRRMGIVAASSHTDAGHATTNCVTHLALLTPVFRIRVATRRSWAHTLDPGRHTRTHMYSHPRMQPFAFLVCCATLDTTQGHAMTNCITHLALPTPVFHICVATPTSSPSTSQYAVTVASHFNVM